MLTLLLLSKMIMYIMHIYYAEYCFTWPGILLCVLSELLGVPAIDMVHCVACVNTTSLCN